jgi:hypothetical protein
MIPTKPMINPPINIVVLTGSGKFNVNPSPAQSHPPTIKAIPRNLNVFLISSGNIHKCIYNLLLRGRYIFSDIDMVVLLRSSLTLML